MQQIKIFSGEEDRTRELEAEVNAWLKENDVRILQVFGNIAPQAVMYAPTQQHLAGAERSRTRRFAPSDVLLVIVYEPNG